jgi:O-acetyl-ADP-ribose deacetylase (regulator of RNase III)
MMEVKYHLRDRSAGMCEAWNEAFQDIDAGKIEVSCGDIFASTSADALVSPANSFGFMDGGIDGVYSRRFGQKLQDRLQALIHRVHDGELPVGQAQIVRIEDDEDFKYLVSAPTMRVPMDVSSTGNAFLAFRAVIRTIERHNTALDRLEANGQDARGFTYIKTVLCPGLATAIGMMPFDQCAKQMRRAYNQSFLKEIPQHRALSFAAAAIAEGDGMMTNRSPMIRNKVKTSTEE